MVGKDSDFTTVANYLTLHFAKNLEQRISFSKIFKVIPIALVFSSNAILCFKLELIDDRNDNQIEHTVQSRKEEMIIKVKKFSKSRIVLLTPRNKLHCKTCSHSKNNGVPCHHMIA